MQTAKEMKSKLSTKAIRFDQPTSFDDIIESIPDEIKLPIAEAASLSALAKSAHRSRSRYNIFCMLFNETKTKSGDEKAKALFIKAAVMATTVTFQNDPKADKTSINKQTFNTFQTLHQAFVLANDTTLKFKILKQYQKYLEDFKDYFNNEHDKLKIKLRAIRLESYFIDLDTRDVGICGPDTQKTAMLSQLKNLFDATSDKNDKKDISSEAIFLINHFREHHKALDKSKQNSVFLSELQKRDEMWSHLRNKSHGCIIS